MTMPHIFSGERVVCFVENMRKSPEWVINGINRSWVVQYLQNYDIEIDIKYYLFPRIVGILSEKFWWSSFLGWS